MRAWRPAPQRPGSATDPRGCANSQDCPPPPGTRSGLAGGNAKWPHHSGHARCPGCRAAAHHQTLVVSGTAARLYVGAIEHPELTAVTPPQKETAKTILVRIA